MLKKLLVLTLFMASTAGVWAGNAIVDRPEKLHFDELKFDIPDANSLRFELSDGTPVYLKEDHTLPLVSLSVYFRGGRYLIPAEKSGLAELVGDSWRTGGAGEMSAQEFDEKLDFLAVKLWTRIDDVLGFVGLNVMSKDLDETLGLTMQMITKPRFQEDRFAKAREDLLQSMKRRNDDTAMIEAREWKRLIYGDDFWVNRLPTQASVDSVTVDDCRNFVSRLLRSGNLVIALSGDIDKKAAIALLEKHLGGLPKMEETLPSIPQPEKSAEPGVYTINKPEVNQGRVRMGHLGYKLGHPDAFALEVGNDILGGGGFTSRMMKTIRSNEGLAYGAYSSINFPVTMPGVFAAYFQSKSSTCAFAAEIAKGLIEDMRKEKVSMDELTTSKNSFIETFPRQFENSFNVVAIFAQDEILGRSHDYWKNYQASIGKVDPTAIFKAMAGDIHPEKLIMLIVGNIEEIMKGSPDHDADFKEFGPIHEIPLRDPMTLE